MILTREEQEILDGSQGKARQKAMDVLVRYGEALGAEKLVDTNNVCGGVPGGLPFVRDFARNAGSIDAVFSEVNLDAGETNYYGNPGSAKKERSQCCTCT